MADHDVEDLDYSRAFLLAPVGLAIARERTIVDCNLALADMFRRDRDALIGKTFAALYPDEQHFVDTGERVGRVLQTQETFANDRVMRRLDGELFWVHVRGRTLRREYPHQGTLWVLTEVAGAFAARNAPKGPEGNKRSDCAGEPKMPSGFNNRS
jgi:PAS domain S-box-containing protein